MSIKEDLNRRGTILTSSMEKSQTNFRKHSTHHIKDNIYVVKSANNAQMQDTLIRGGKK